MENLYSEKNEHRNNLDFLRFILVIFIFFSNVYIIYNGTIALEPLWRLSKHQLSLSTLAINFFFVISGFLTLQSWANSKGGIDFLKNRILRIYPGFLIASLVCVLVLGPMGNGSLFNPFPHILDYLTAVDFRQVAFSSVLLLPPDLPETLAKSPYPNALNSPLWVIWYGFACYLFILFAGLLGLFKKKFIPLILFLLVYSFNVWYNGNIQQDIFGKITGWNLKLLSGDLSERLLNGLHFLMFFLAGTCFYYYREYIPRIRSLATVSLAFLGAALLWGNVFELVQVLFGSYLLFYVAFNKKIRLYNFAKYGQFSYGIYLYGWPIQQLVLLYIGTKLSIYGVVIVSLLIVLSLAFISWHLIERQFLRLKNLHFNLTKYQQRVQPLYDEKSGRHNNFYFLRFFMISTVIFTHSYSVYYQVEGNVEPLTAFSLNQISIGTPGLNFFFVVSGFLISQSWLYSKSWKDFTIRRLLRVYPGYITVLLFCVYIVGPLGVKIFNFNELIDYWSQVDLFSVLSNALTLSFPPTTPETLTTLPLSNVLNASLWSVRFEVYYYFLIVLFGISGLFRKRGLLLALFIGVYFINIIHKRTFDVYNSWGEYDYQWIPYFPPKHFETLLDFEHYLNYFMAGVIFFAFRDLIPRSKVLAILSVIIIAISIHWLRIFEFVQPIFGTYLLLYFAYSKTIKLASLERYGDFTYGMYLYSWPIQQLVLLYLGDKLTIKETFVVAMLFIIPVAALSWHFIEKPFMLLKNKTFYFGISKRRLSIKL